MKNRHKAQVHCSPRGFQYTLPNGYRLSVMFGAGNYSDNRYREDQGISDGYISSPNFEVAVLTPDDEFVDLIDEVDEYGVRYVDQVIGWVPAWTLPRLLSRVKYFPDPKLHDQLKAYALAFGKFCRDARDEEKKTRGSSETGVDLGLTADEAEQYYGGEDK